MIPPLCNALSLEEIFQSKASLDSVTRAAHTVDIYLYINKNCHSGQLQKVQMNNFRDRNVTPQPRY